MLQNYLPWGCLIREAVYDVFLIWQSRSMVSSIKHEAYFMMFNLQIPCCILIEYAALLTGRVRISPKMGEIPPQNWGRLGVPGTPRNAKLSILTRFPNLNLDFANFYSFLNLKKFKQKGAPAFKLQYYSGSPAPSTVGIAVTGPGLLAQKRALEAFLGVQKGPFLACPGPSSRGAPDPKKGPLGGRRGAKKPLPAEVGKTPFLG